MAGERVAARASGGANRPLGTKFASAILRYLGGGRTTTVARLPEGTRYAGVAVLRGRIYVSGGLTARGLTDAVYEVTLTGRVRQVAKLPAPEDHAAMMRGVRWLDAYERGFMKGAIDKARQVSAEYPPGAAL